MRKDEPYPKLYRGILLAMRDGRHITDLEYAQNLPLANSQHGRTIIDKMVKDRGTDKNGR